MSQSWSLELSRAVYLGGGGGRGAKGDEGQGKPFMSVHLRERRERFWGNAVKMHTALGAEGRGESRPQEWSWPLSMAREGL